MLIQICSWLRTWNYYLKRPAYVTKFSLPLALKVSVAGLLFESEYRRKKKTYAFFFGGGTTGKGALGKQT